MILGERVLRIDPRQAFNIFFQSSTSAWKALFLSEYAPEKGFSFEIRGDQYWIYTLSYRWHVNQDKYDEKSLFVSKYEPLTQQDTLNQAIAPQIVKVTGLDRSHFVLNNERSKAPVPGDGLQSLTAFAASREQAERRASFENNRNQIDFLHLHQQLINEKEKYEREKLFSVAYSGFKASEYHTQDGTVYLFEISEDDEGEDEYRKKFAENTPVEIPANDGGKGITGAITQAEGRLLHIILHSQESVTRIAETGIIRERINPEYRYKNNAIKALREQSSPNRYLLPILADKTLQPYREEKTYIPKDSRINKSQKEAIQKAINVKDFLLVQGPPGTGKTTIITEMIKEFVHQGLRILVCSKNNLAVDNVMEKCQALTYGDDNRRQIQCLRLGVEEKVLKSVHSCLSRPLTMKIQNDIKAQSEKVRSVYITQEAERQKQYEQAVRETESICALADPYLGMKRVARETISHFQDSRWSSLLAGRKKEVFLKEAAFLYQQAEVILQQLSGMIRTKTIKLQDSAVQQNLRLANEYFEVAERFSREIRTAPFRYRMILGDQKEKIAEAAAGFMQAKEEILKTICSLARYHGNPIADDLTPDLQKETLSSDFVKQFRAAAEAQIKSYKARRFMLKDILDEWHDELQNDQSSLEDVLLRTVRIIGATCIGVNTKADFKDAEYDVAIVDEAGQITLHDLLVPLVKAKKTILIGDHLQLPPGNEDDYCAYLRRNRLLDFENLSDAHEIEEYEDELKQIFSVSLFEKLFRDDRFDRNKVLLDTQHRMNPVIAKFISEQFYEGKYQSGVSEEERTICIGNFTRPLYFIDTCHERNKNDKEDAKSYVNPKEAEICARILADMLVRIENGDYTAGKPLKENKDGRDEYDIGIITAYRKQIERIRERTEVILTDRLGSEKAATIVSSLAINTLDSFQGRDNQIILYSFVRSNEKHAIGFLQEVRRLNVMMTRAKSLLIMVGDSDTLTKSSQRTIHDGRKASEYYSALIDYCKKVQGYMDCTAMKI